MKRRQAMKIINRGMNHTAETMPYTDRQLTRAVAVLWRDAGKSVRK